MNETLHIVLFLEEGNTLKKYTSLRSGARDVKGAHADGEIFILCNSSIFRYKLDDSLTLQQTFAVNIGYNMSGLAILSDRFVVCGENKLDLLNADASSIQSFSSSCDG